MIISYKHRNLLVKLVEKMRVNKVIQMVVSQKNLVKGCMILEVGCEEGYVIGNVPDSFYRIGLDFLSEPLSKAKKVCDDVVRADALHLPFKVVDCVICSETLEHVQDPFITIQEIARVAKYIILSVPNDENILKIKKLLLFLG